MFNKQSVKLFNPQNGLLMRILSVASSCHEGATLRENNEATKKKKKSELHVFTLPKEFDFE